jgi:hypothetical protein
MLIGNSPNGIWDGDRRLANHGEWGLWSDPDYVSPFDIDNNGWVELPFASDPNADNYLNQHDKYGNPYTKRRVLEHTITHEIGHALAGAYHSNDPECLMYRYSNNWKRDDRLSDYYKSLLRVHNIMR